MSAQIVIPPLNGLRAFDAAGRHLNFRVAAEELGVTQGAVAQQVRGLEEHLGLRLFLREPRGLAFTEEGRGYHAAIARALADIAEATANLRPAPSRATISATPTFASKWLIPRLPEFAEAHPDIDLRITATERISSFQADGVDLAVRQGQPPFAASLHADLLFRQEVVTVCSPRLLAGRRLPLDADALTRLTLLHDTHDLWPRFAQAVFGSDELPARGLRFNQTTLSLDAALAGQGVALASRFLVRRDIEAGRLAQPVPSTFRGDQDFYLLAPRTRLSRAAATTRAWLLETARREDA